MRRPVALASLVLLLPPLLSCTSSTDRASRPESASGSVAATPDAVAPHGRFASDGTLVIQVSATLHETLRPVADSFASREAINVVFSPPPEGAESEPLGISPAADLVIVTADVMARLPITASAWVLPFAESMADSAAMVDSVRTSARAPARRPARRATGRRADSIRADSARRAAAREDSILAARARADSARVLVLTVPAQAPNSAVAERFVRYLLTGGRATLLRSGLHVLPRLALRGSAAPPGIAALVDTMIPTDTAVNVESMPPR